MHTLHLSLVELRKGNWVSYYPHSTQDHLVSVTSEQRSIMRPDAKPLLECLLQSLLWTWKVMPLPFSCERPALWKPDTWLLLLPVPPICTPLPPPATTCFTRAPFPFLWNNLVKSAPSSRCFNRLQSAAVDSPFFLLNGGKRAPELSAASEDQKEMCVQKDSAVPLYLTDAFVCLAVPTPPSSQHTYQAIIKHDRQSSSSVTLSPHFPPCFHGFLQSFFAKISFCLHFC